MGNPRQFEKPDDEMTVEDWEAFSDETEQMYQEALKAWDEYAQDHPEITREQWMQAVLRERAEHGCPSISSTRTPLLAPTAMTQHMPGYAG